MLFEDIRTIAVMREARRLTAQKHLGQHNVLPVATVLYIQKYAPSLLGGAVETLWHSRLGFGAVNPHEALTEVAKLQHKRLESVYQDALLLWIETNSK